MTKPGVFCLSSRFSKVKNIHIQCLSIQIREIKYIGVLESDMQLLATNFPLEITIEWCFFRSRAPGYNLRMASFGTVKGLIFGYYYWIKICLHRIVLVQYIA